MREENGLNFFECGVELFGAAFVFEEVELFAGDDELVLVEFHFGFEMENAIGEDDIAVFRAERRQDFFVAVNGEVDSGIAICGLAWTAVAAPLALEGCFKAHITPASHCFTVAV